MHNKFRVGFAVLLLSTLACEPVIAVGWREISCIFVLVAILFGPPVYRFIRSVENYKKRKDK